MNCTHSTASITTGGGGITEALRQLASAQAAIGIDIQVVGFNDGCQPILGWPGNNPLGLIPKNIPGFPWATRFRHALSLSAPDILHTHGLWLQPSVVGPRFARSRQIPWIVSPHGMLDPWSLANSRWKKQIASYLFENRNLRGAACLHALSQSEVESMRAYGLLNPIAVIPNGVILPQDRGQRTEDGGCRKTLLFLGRLHPKKGLVNALRGWNTYLRSTIRNPQSSDWIFVIAGWDQGGHEADLKRLCDELGLSYLDLPASDYVGETPALLESSVRSSMFDVQCSTFASSSPANSASVIFTGPAFGSTKDQLLRRASAFILPSFSEGLPMSVLEAWAYRLPVLMTEHCNLPEGFAAAAALRLGTDVASIAEGMRLLLRSPTSDLRSLGANGRALVERQFTWPQVAAQMKEVYEWVLGGGDAPGCVE